VIGDLGGHVLRIMAMGNAVLSVLLSIAVTPPPTFPGQTWSSGGC